MAALQNGLPEPPQENLSPTLSPARPPVSYEGRHAAGFSLWPRHSILFCFQNLRSLSPARASAPWGGGTESESAWPGEVCGERGGCTFEEPHHLPSSRAPQSSRLPRLARNVGPLWGEREAPANPAGETLVYKEGGCEVQGSKGFGPQGLFLGLEQKISLWQLFRNQSTVPRQVRPKPAPLRTLLRGLPGGPDWNRLLTEPRGKGPERSKNTRGRPHACPSVPEKGIGEMGQGLQMGAFRASQPRTP